MLLRFAVENFLSFKEITEFSMIAGKATRHKDHLTTQNGKRILKGTLLFGANASGKTNLIRAIDFSRDIILSGLENIDLNKKYFRLDNSCKEKPGVFQFDILSNNHFYSYGFAVSYIKKTIEEEWLYRTDSDNDFCVFLRSKSNNGFDFHSDLVGVIDDRSQQDRFRVYSEDISSNKMSNKLFLSDIVMRISDSESAYQSFHDVFDWFMSLRIIFPNSKYGDITGFLENSDNHELLESLLNHFDTGIQTVTTRKIDFDKAFAGLSEKSLSALKRKIDNDLNTDCDKVVMQNDTSLIEVRKGDDELTACELVSNHGNTDDLFEFTEESDGTQRLFDLIPVFRQVRLNRVIIIDELDRSLHTMVAQEFIKYYYSLAKNHNSQLIVTTHDSNLLDLNMVRQDEIWFVERNEDNSSRLYSLNKFKARFDKDVEKDYLLGRYGAIPILHGGDVETDCVGGESND